MYIRIAKKNPKKDYSVPGWIPNNMLVGYFENNLDNPTSQNIIEALKEDGWIVPFSTEELEKALGNDEALDSLPKIHVGAVCCFKADSIEEWIENYHNDLERMGYFHKKELLAEMRVWEVFGKEKDVDDMEGVYVIAKDAKDITEEVLKALKKF
jgi:hypothetical protein